MLGAENSQVLGQAIVSSLRPERGQAGVGGAGGCLGSTGPGLALGTLSGSGAQRSWLSQ